jgi:hypothetical protein
MRKIGCRLDKSINLQKDFFKKIEYKEKKNKQRGRPRKYKDEFIIAIFLYQTHLGREITSAVRLFERSISSFAALQRISFSILFFRIELKQEIIQTRSSE